MKSGTLDRIRSMRDAAYKLLNFHSLYREKFASNSSCDKKGYGFGRDKRFSSFILGTSFDSWHGYFGNSSCSTILNISDQETVQKYFVRAMNVHQEELFATTARLLQEDAASLIGDAEKELAGLVNLLNAAKEPHETQETRSVGTDGRERI